MPSLPNFLFSPTQCRSYSSSPERPVYGSTLGCRINEITCNSYYYQYSVCKSTWGTFKIWCPDYTPYSNGNNQVRVLTSYSSSNIGKETLDRLIFPCISFQIFQEHKLQAENLERLAMCLQCCLVECHLVPVLMWMAWSWRSALLLILAFNWLMAFCSW